MRALLLALLLPVVARSSLQVDLVLSHFAEPLDAVAAFVQRARAALLQAAEPAELRSVYLVTHASRAAIEGRTDPPWQVLHVPCGNCGRESSAYLFWIEQHGREDGLDLVWFSHAVPDAYMERTLWPRLKLLSRRTGMLGLAIVGGTSCSGANDPALGPLMSAIYFAHTGVFCRESTGWSVMFNAEFIVSARRLRMLHPWLAKRLRKQLEAPDDDLIHLTPGWQTPTMTPQNSSRVSPILGYAIERMWNLWFNCTRWYGPSCDDSAPCVADAAQCLDEVDDDRKT